MSTPASIIEQAIKGLYITNEGGFMAHPSDVARIISEVLQAAGYSIVPTDRLNGLRGTIEEAVDASNKLRAILAGVPR